jgi:hypothetical protein
MSSERILPGFAWTGAQHGERLPFQRFFRAAERGVMRFPRQSLSSRELGDFAARWGELEVNVANIARMSRYVMLHPDDAIGVLVNRVVRQKSGAQPA